MGPGGGNKEAGRVAVRLYDRLMAFVSQQIKLLLDSTTVKDAKEIVESSLYATLGTMVISRFQSEKKISQFDMKHPGDILKVERIVADEICKIAAERLEDCDRGAKYRIVIVKIDRPLKNG
jgi:hypothetical protein